MEQISVERYEIHRSTNSSESSRAENGWGQGKEIIQKNYFSQSLQNTIFIALVSLDQRFFTLRPSHLFTVHTGDNCHKHFRPA